VDNVRENIIAFSRLNPTRAKFKVFIIDEVHMLSISAFNALLKIIEEPPAYVVFILCTTEIQKVPGTIISRCERYDFKRISVKEVVKKLTFIAAQEKVTVGADVLEAVARRSGGHLRDAESLLGQIFSLGDKEISREQAELVIPHYNSDEAVSLLDYLGRKDAAKAVALINILVDSGVNMKIFTGEIINLLRQVMLNRLSPGLVDNLGLDLGESLEKHLAAVAENLEWEDIFRFTRRFLEVSVDNRSPLIPQLPLELAVAELCFGAPRLVASTSQDMSLSKKTIVASAAKKNIVANVANISDSAPTITSEPLKVVAPDLTTDEIMAKWPEFLVRIKKYNHSLSFVLQNCEPREVKDNKLCLVFKYKFHRDRINDASIKIIVENTLAEVFGSGLVLSSLIDENLELKREEKPLKSTSGLRADLLKTFGGEVIN
jgi:DNA polymerase-3 subunit gamma/tau